MTAKILFRASISPQIPSQVNGGASVKGLPLTNSEGDWNYRTISDEIDTKVTQVPGQALSDQNYTLAEKQKLAGVANNANNYTLPTGDGYMFVPATGTISNNLLLRAGATPGSISWQPITKADVGLANANNTPDSSKVVAGASYLTSNYTINGVPFNGTQNITVYDPTKLPLAGGTVTGQVLLTSGINSGAYNQGALVVSGGIGISGSMVMAGNLTVSSNIYAGGSVIASGDVAGLSDRRLKTDLQKIENALEKVCSLTGYTFTMHDPITQEPLEGKRTGLIAQDVQEVLPEVVVPAGDYIALSYGNMVGLLVQAIKELKAEVDSLKEVK